MKFEKKYFSFKLNKLVSTNEILDYRKGSKYSKNVFSDNIALLKCAIIKIPICNLQNIPDKNIELGYAMFKSKSALIDIHDKLQNKYYIHEIKGNTFLMDFIVIKFEGEYSIGKHYKNNRIR
jgi:hypothetical protein